MVFIVDAPIIPVMHQYEMSQNRLTQLPFTFWFQVGMIDYRPRRNYVSTITSHDRSSDIIIATDISYTVKEVSNSCSARPINLYQSIFLHATFRVSCHFFCVKTDRWPTVIIRVSQKLIAVASVPVPVPD